jgi:hypothetical protein
VSANFGLRQPTKHDDYPWVELMRLIDRAAAFLQMPSIFYQGFSGPFIDPYQWLVLVELLNKSLRHSNDPLEEGSDPFDTAEILFDWIDEAEILAGAKLKLGRLPPDVRQVLIETVVREARRPDLGMSAAVKLIMDPNARRPGPTGVGTKIIEFARGGPVGAAMPLDPPRGNARAVAGQQLRPGHSTRGRG